MTLLNSHEYDIDNKFTIEEFRNILTSYENEGATHLSLSYQDYGNPIVNIFEEVKEQEKNIPVTYATIKRKIGWSRFAEKTNRNVYAINEFGGYQDNEMFYISEEQADSLGL